MAQPKGLKDLYVAEITEDSAENYTTSKPVRLMKAASVKTKLKYTNEPVYFDDVQDDSDNDFEEGTIEIEGDYLSRKIREMIRGHKNLGGMTVTNADDKAKDVAIGYRTKLTNGLYKFYWWYRVNFGEEEDEEAETIAKKGKRQNAKIKGTIIPRKKDRNIGVDADEMDLADAGSAKAILDEWFGQVQEPKSLGAEKKVSE